MADISDVLDTLAATIANLLYPDGVDSELSDSVADVPVSIYVGWPKRADLDPDLARGRCHVTVFDTGAERDTTRYFRDEQAYTPNHPLVATLDGQTVTISGDTTEVQNICILIQNKPYIYQTSVNESISSVVSRLLAAVIEDYPESVKTGLSLVLPDYANVRKVTVGGIAATISNIKQQEKVVQVSIWADTPDNRASIAKAFDGPLAASNFLLLSDDTKARIIYSGSRNDDYREVVGLYRRDIMYRVDFSTTISGTATEVISSTATLQN